MFNQVNINLQQSVLILLLFTDFGKLVAQMLPVEDWASDPSIYNLAKSCYDYWENYGTCPKNEIYNIIALNPKIHPDAKENLERLVASLEVRLDAGINAEYTLDKIRQHHRVSSLKRAVQEVIPYMDDPDKIDELEAKLAKGLKNSYEAFDPGEDLYEGALSLFERINKGSQATEGIMTGIDSLDRKGIRAFRKAMLLYMASSGKGKSWFMVHMGRQALMQGETVVHITLELSKEDVEERYLQNLFALYTFPPDVDDNRIDLTESGFNLVNKTAGNTGHLYDPGVIAEKIKTLSTTSYMGRHNLLIKHFPTNSLSINKLEAYLDAIKTTINFDPTTLIIDYPDHMEVKNASNLKAEIGHIYKEIRRIADERNLYLIVCTQSNRSGSEAQRLDMRHMGDDISKYQTADIVLTWSATEFEQSMGMGRLFVAKARKSQDMLELLVAQNLTIGQYHMSHLVLNKHTMGMFKTFKDQYGPKG